MLRTTKTNVLALIPTVTFIQITSSRRLGPPSPNISIPAKELSGCRSPFKLARRWLHELPFHCPRSRVRY